MFYDPVNMAKLINELNEISGKIETNFKNITNDGLKKICDKEIWVSDVANGYANINKSVIASYLALIDKLTNISDYLVNVHEGYIGE